MKPAEAGILALMLFSLCPSLNAQPGQGQGQGGPPDDPGPPGMVSCAGHDVDLAFGSSNALRSAPTDTSATLDVSCHRSGGPPEVEVTVSLGTGIHGSSISDRRMAEAGARDTLAYNIFRDASMTSIWGQTPGVDTVSQTLVIGNNETAVARFTLFARIPPGQDVYAGHYSDNLILQLDF